MNIHRIYGAISPWFRERRMARFRALLAPRNGERVLDVGGTPWFWLGSGLERSVTLLNLETSGIASPEAAPFTLVTGDGCALTFGNASYDIVFSNSAIEHVGTWGRQQAFAREALRVGQRVWVQTPAREFFIEPHLIAPFIHWLPLAWQRRLVRNFTVRGWLERPDPAKVDAFLEEVRLLTFSEMQALFPGCTILRERFLGLTKSYIAVRPAS